MTNDWIAFEESGYEKRRLNARVLLTKDKQFRINRKALELLGEPKAVRFFFDVGRSRIGIKAEVPEAVHAFPIRNRERGQTVTVHGALFCNRFGIKPESTLEFDGVRVDGDGILILEMERAKRPA